MLNSILRACIQQAVHAGSLYVTTMISVRKSISADLGSGGGSVGRAVVSVTRDPQFESYHWQNFINQLYTQITEKTKIKNQLVRKKWEQFPLELLQLFWAVMFIRKCTEGFSFLLLSGLQLGRLSSERGGPLPRPLLLRPQQRESRPDERTGN